MRIDSKIQAYPGTSVFRQTHKSKKRALAVPCWQCSKKDCLLAGSLACSLACLLACLPACSLAGSLAPFLACSLAPFLACLLACLGTPVCENSAGKKKPGDGKKIPVKIMYPFFPGILSCILSGILSGIYSDILLFWHSIMAFPSGILSAVLSDILCWHSICRSIWHSLLAFYLASILTFYYVLFRHSNWHLFWQSLACADVRQCPLRSGPRSWGGTRRRTRRRGGGRGGSNSYRT